MRTIRQWLQAIENECGEARAKDVEADLRRLIPEDYEEEYQAALDAPINEDGYCVADGFCYAPANTANGYEIISWDPGTDYDNITRDDIVNTSSILGDNVTHGDMLDMITQYGDPWFCLT